ncbi:MAG: NAD(P)-dependent glycerol-3-phosphate dehydrogenase [Candidatus Omnitrophica bacterium]|nr:NAD(P)-dependent glycerol-3-phosphate dehydrogenase [Candidatus Omnitrophota bacterium]
MLTKKVAIIGDGGWGTTLAVLLYYKGYNTTLWSAFSDYAEVLDKERENKKFLPGVKIPKNIRITSDLNTLEENDLYIIAVPCQYLRKTLKNFAGIIKRPVVSAVKGIENSSLKRPSEVITDVLGKLNLSVLSGPTIAYEVVRGIPTTCIISSEDNNTAYELQKIFSTEKFRVYTSNDIIGAELAGALKNIIAIAAGISDGMSFGVNTKAALLTRGLVEIARLGVEMGAGKDTFNGLSGVGDLATTCMSFHSRNRWFGEEIGKGKSLKKVLSETKMVIEGVATTKSAYELAKKYKVEMPITEQIYQVLYKGKNPKEAVRELMTRAPKSE